MKKIHVRDYLQLTKPGINLSNLLACFVGYWLAGSARFDAVLAVTLLGTAFVIAGSCALNNYIDRDIDPRMERTRDRAIPAGRISPREAIWIGFVCTGLGLGILFVGVNSVTGWLAAGGAVIYVGLYSLWLKRVSVYNTVAGSVSGAIPPLIGWAAATGGLDAAAWSLFILIFAWQPPHFFALAMLKSREYQEAGVPMLPVVKGFQETKEQMIFWVAFLLPVSLYLHAAGMVENGYLIPACLLGGTYLVLSAFGFFTRDLEGWTRWMFRYSLLYLTVMLAAMILFAAGV
ncbi:protoheme IX farnesyltransferase [Paludifilum halophilum]|uniref:Protoheme IX farnesyltransferase n=2 Tax=Paludifilum halophilum TaxID=1642702 RepID=A0A235B426_9BACL|nr:protoheme IX farnesyltransferase [Paludifilum halophilum]